METTSLSCLELDVALIATAPRHQAIEMCNHALAGIRAIEERGFTWRALIFQQVEKRELWRDDCDEHGEVYSSMHDWITKKSGYSVRDFYAGKAMLKDLSDVPVEDLTQISGVNLNQMRKLSGNVRIQSVEAAKLLSEDEFVAHIQENHPNQHIEKPVKPTLRLTGSVQDALDKYAEAYPEITDRQGQLEGLCVDWLQEMQ